MIRRCPSAWNRDRARRVSTCLRRSKRLREGTVDGASGALSILATARVDARRSVSISTRPIAARRSSRRRQGRCFRRPRRARRDGRRRAPPTPRARAARRDAAAASEARGCACRNRQARAPVAGLSSHRKNRIRGIQFPSARSSVPVPVLGVSAGGASRRARLDECSRNANNEARNGMDILTRMGNDT